MNAITKVIAPEAVSVEVLDAKDVAQVELHKLAITRSWSKVASTIIETAQALKKAKRELERPQYREVKQHLIENRIMSGTVISKLMKIANDPVLSDPNNVNRLPSSYATLYAIALKDSESVKTAIDSGAINAGTQLKDLRLIFPSTGKAEPEEPVMTITIRGEVPADLLGSLSDILSQIAYCATVSRKGF